MYARESSTPRVLPIVRSIRNRWRMRVALRGTSIVLALGFGAFLLSAYGLEWARFSPAAVTTLRTVAWVAVAVATVVFLVRPLMRRISDEQVALYLEEREPSLEAQILGAVEVEKGRDPALRVASPELLDRLVERAVDRAREVENGKRIDQKGLYRSSGALAVVSLGILAFLFLGPADLRYGMNALFFPTTDAAEVNPYSIAVTPGDVTVARGSDQFVSADLEGFDSDEVFVFMRSTEGQPYQRLSMLPADSGTYELLLLNLVEATDYFVESNGVRSPTYTIEVAELPYVERMEQTLRFPAYTGLEPRVREDAGDVAALAGTVVEIRVHPTLSTGAGRILVNDEPWPDGRLTVNDDGTLTGRFIVDRPGVYEIELARGDGRLVSASPQYTIDVLEDLAPSIAFDEPGRDIPVSPIEETYLEARADDDFGVRDVRLVYSVNGAEEDTVSIFEDAGTPLTEVSAGHTLFLEEWDLEAGDVVSYYAIARDNRRGESAQVVSDIYFLNVRPFRRDFRAREQQGGGPPQGAGQQGGADTPLSEIQRQVVAATFNLLRDREVLSEEEFGEAVVSVALAQGRVKEQVSTLVERMTNRGLANADEQFREIAEMLPGAIEDMEASEELLRQEEPRDALSPQQRALRVLQKAEETYERFVGQQQQGGGGGGGQGADAEDLADLFELELDKLRNQYETVQRGERQQNDNQVDELMEELEELARRQQQEMERQRRRAAGQQQQGSAGGGASAESQRELAEQTEEAARRLERLARETGDRQLQETARRLREAAESMRRAASNSGRSQGVADATSASDELEEAQRRLERAREDRMRNAAEDALERVERLAENERRIQDELEDMSDDPGERAEQVRRMHERKDRMLQETTELERQLDRMAADARRDDPEAADEFAEAAQTIRDSKLKEKIAWSKGVVAERDPGVAREFEEEIADDIQKLREETQQAARAADRVADDRSMEQALERAQELVRGSRSLDRRLRGDGREGESGDEARDPSDREGAREGDPGQRGQEGERAEEGRQTGEGGGGEGRQATRGGEPTGGADGGAARAGDPQPIGGATGGSPRPLSEEEIRQFRREFEERARDARELRRSLAEEGWDVDDLDEAIRAMDELQQAETYGDLPQIAILQETIRENLKRVEFTLRRAIEGESAGRGALSSSDDVPAGFRELVEEYYESLARDPGGGGGG